MVVENDSAPKVNKQRGPNGATCSPQKSRRVFFSFFLANQPFSSFKIFVVCVERPKLGQSQHYYFLTRRTTNGQRLFGVRTKPHKARNSPGAFVAELPPKNRYSCATLLVAHWPISRGLMGDLICILWAKQKYLGGHRAKQKAVDSPNRFLRAFQRSSETSLAADPSPSVVAPRRVPSA